MSALINAVAGAANGSVPGAQAQPVDDDWASRIGTMAKRVLFGAGNFALSVDPDKPNMYNEGFVPDASQMQPSVTPQDREASARDTFGIPKGDSLESRLPEEIGGALAGAPFSGGPVGQVVNAGLGVGLPEALHAIIGGAQAAPETDPYAANSEPDPYAAAHEVDKPAPYAPRLDGVAPNEAHDDPYYKPDDWLDSKLNDGRYWAGAGVIAATALGAIALMKYNESTAASLAMRVGELTSDKTVPRVTQLATALNTGILDRNAPVKDFFATMDPANSQLFSASVDTKLTNAAVNQKIASTMQTGEYAGTSVSGTAPADFYTAVGKQTKEVDPAIAQVEQHLGWQAADSGTKQFDNYLLAANELDVRRAAEAKWLTNQYANTGVMPAARSGTAAEIRPNMWDKSTNELEQYVRAGDANPVFSALRDQHKGMMQDMGEYMLQKGLISQRDLAEFRGAYPNYTPIMQRTDDPMMTRIMDSMLPKFDRLKWDNQASLLDRSLTDKGGISGAPGDGQFSALASTDNYMQSMMKFAETNDIRKWFLGKAMSWQQGQTGPKVFATAAPDDAQAMMFKAAGKDYYVKVTDPAVRSSLEAAPILTNPLWNATRGIMQTTVTGALAPWFSLANVIHMSFRGALARTPGTAFGYGDKLMNMAGWKGGNLDPTAAFTGAVDGVVRNMYGHAMNGISEGLRQSIQNDGVLSKVFGNNAQAVADSMSDAYLRTTLHGMQSGGVGHTGAMGSIGEGDFLSSLATQAPAYSGNPLGLKSLYNVYDAVISSVRNGAEAHYYAMNTRSTATDAEKVISAGMTRDLGGDPARHGSATLTNAVTSAMPYLNVTMQGTAKLARAFKDNPLSFTTGVISTVGVPAVVVSSMISNLTPEERDAYYKLSPETRTSYIVIPLHNVAPENWPRVPMAPELRGMWALGMTMLDKMYGLSSNVIDHQDNRDIKGSLSTLVENLHADDLKTAALSQAFAGLPPLVSGGLALGGMQLDPGASGSMVNSISGQRLDNFDPTPTKFADDALSAVHEKLITSFFGQLGQIGIQTARAFHYASQGTGSTTEGVKAAASAGVEELARRVPEVSGMLWGVPQRLSPHNADGDLLTHKMDAMKNLERTASVQIDQGGSTTPAGQSLIVNHGGVQNTDLGQILIAVKAFQTTTLKGLMDQRANAYSQMSAINGASSINMPNKQTLSNGYVKTIEETNRAALDAVHEFEDKMTATHPLLAQKMGGRITLENLVGQR